MSGLDKRQARARRHRRVRKKVHGTEERPRLCVYRSNRHLYAQVIVDDRGHTLVAASTRQSGRPNATRAEARELGKRVAELCLAKEVRRVVFDRGGYRFHGRVREVAEGAREGGLEF